MASYSIIIRGGLVFNGKGSAPEKADIGITDDHIEMIGDLSNSTAPTTVNAEGMYVSPGFIDITNHSDTHWTLFDNPGQESLLRQGVTTIIGGNCGSSLAPLVHAQDIEGIQKWVDISKINVDWQSMSEFLDNLETRKITLNFGTLVGHGSLRRAVDVDITKPAPKDKIEQMKFLLEESLKSGALGLSTSLGRSHGLSAEHEELSALFSVVKKYGGFTTNHLRDEGFDVVAATSSILSLTRELSVRTHISHFKTLGRKAWEKQESVLKMIETARDQNVPITLDVFPYTSTGSNLYMLLPGWAIEGGKKDILSRLEDPITREQVVTDLKKLTLHYENIIIASALRDTVGTGHSIFELAKESNVAPENIVVDLLRTSELQVSIFNQSISEENLNELLKKDYIAISSDGSGLTHSGNPESLPHPRSFGTFPRIFKHFVKENGLLNWTKAIYKMTGLPASITSIERRGLLEKGYFADIVVFDPESITDKAGYKTPRQFSEGIRWVIINGKISVVQGLPSEDRNGKILKRK